MERSTVISPIWPSTDPLISYKDLFYSVHVCELALHFSDTHFKISLVLFLFGLVTHIPLCSDHPLTVSGWQEANNKRQITGTTMGKMSRVGSYTIVEQLCV